MKRLLNFGSVVVALALLAVATTSLRSHSPSDDPFRFYHGFGVGEKISGRWWREQASGRLKRNGGQRAVVLAMPFRNDWWRDFLKVARGTSRCTGSRNLMRIPSLAARRL